MIVLNDPEHGHILAEAAGVIFNPAVDRVIARLYPSGAVRGGMVFNGYTGSSIGIHMAGFDPKWADRTLIWMCFDYCFNQIGCKKVFGQVPAKNARALEINRKLGFKIEAHVKDVFPDDDLIVISMTREDCRWLGCKPKMLSEEAV